jgi:bla regulator protein blaR1
MTTTLVLRDLFSFSLQLAAIIGAGAAICRLLRVRESAITLACWRILLLACLLLPLCQPWHVSMPAGLDVSPPPIVGQPTPIAVENAAATTMFARAPLLTSEAVLLFLGAGVVVRTLWLILGACSLQRLRRTAARLDPVPLIVREAEARIGVRADFYTSDRITGPITFGFRRPVVMLPPGVLSMESELQEAIACHELVHVRRNDWLHVVGEEVIRTVFWFHPAIWWLTGRIQLSREHVVDEAVIRLTQSRDRYVEALLAVALTGSRDLLTPAPLFLRRRFLKRRVAHILQETAMTTRRIIASVTVSAGALVLAAILAVRSFPLEARAGQEPSAHGSSAPIQIISGAEHLLHAALPEYPRRAIEQRVEGDVVLDLTVDERGEVSDARVLSGPEELRRAALESVLQWHYSPDALRSTGTQVALRFQVPAAGEWTPREHASAVIWEKQEKAGHELSPGQHAERQMMELEKALRDPSATDGQREEYKLRLAKVKEQLEEIHAAREGAPRVAGTQRLERIRTERISPEIAQEIHARAGVSIGDPITEAAAKRIRDIVKSIDEHFSVSFERSEAGGVVLAIIAP